MATTYTHSKISVVDENSDVNIIYPENTGSDVSIDTSQNSDIPSGITNVQELANALSPAAFGSGSGEGGTDYSQMLKNIYINTQSICINLGIETSIKDTTDDYTWYPYASLYSSARRLLTINADGTSTSDYRFTLQGLLNVINSGESTKYINDVDYIGIIANNGDKVDMYFFPDPYYDANADGTTSMIATHHIDMISKARIPNSNIPMRTTNTNNGTAEQKNPYLASNEPGCVQAFLADYYTNNIPDVLKAHIIKKKLVVPYRYNGTGTLTRDNGSGLEELPELWIPFKRELVGNSGSGNSAYENDMVQYSNIFDTKSNRPHACWLASTENYDSNSNRWLYTAANDGGISTGGISATNSNTYIPLCFRFV